MVTGRDATLAVMNSAVSARATFQGDPAAEVEALAALLAEVVERAVFPARWAQVAELAMEHESVRRALLDLLGTGS